LTGGGVVLGFFGGITMSFILNYVHDPVLEINFTIVCAYLTFYLAEDTFLHVSGIIALVVMGLYMTNIGKTRIS
jgi:CPA1 family monovalent cation:H+ antiporter